MQPAAPFAAQPAAVSPHLPAAVSPHLLDVLVCPSCHSRVTFLAGPGGGVLCSGCRSVYPVVDGIPVMLIDRRLHHPDAVADPVPNTVP